MFPWVRALEFGLLIRWKCRDFAYVHVHSDCATISSFGSFDTSVRVAIRFFKKNSLLN